MDGLIRPYPDRDAVVPVEAGELSVSTSTVTSPER